MPCALSDRLERIRALHDLPALGAAIVRGGEHGAACAVVGVRQVGSSDRVKLDDRFHIASCTKSVTATLAAALVGEGYLGWETRLAEAVPALDGAMSPQYRTATLERLLAHAAQMPPYTQFDRERMEQLKSIPGSPSEQRLAFLAEALCAEPHSPILGQAAYSNAGYTAAAVMLECITCEPWEALVERYVAEPLGLTTIGFGWPATVQNPIQPRGHIRRDGRLVAQPLDDAYVLPTALAPAGAIHCSVEDLARYALDHLDGLRGREALLPSAAYARLHCTLNGTMNGFSLGWGVREDQRWGVVHFGAGSGGTFFVRIDIVPDLDTAVVTVSNSGDAGPAAREAMESILADSLLRN